MSISHQEWDADVRWRREQMPIRVTFFLGSEDYIRGYIRGDNLDGTISVKPIISPCQQSVILQGSAEADRVIAQMTNLKIKRARPFGGATSERVL